MANCHRVRAIDGAPPEFNDALVKVEPMALKVARRLSPIIRDDLLDDLRSEGYVALLECWQRYDANNLRGATFRTYALHRVYGAMTEWLRWNLRKDGIIRKPKGEKGLRKVLEFVPIDDAAHVSVPSIADRFASDDQARWLEAFIPQHCSPRQAEVLLLSATQRSPNEISAVLHISAGRIRHHKLDGQRRVQDALLAAQA